MSKPAAMETAEYAFVISPSAWDHSRPKPETMTITAEFGAVSHAGKVRTKNEDHFLVSQISRKQEILSTNLPEDQFPSYTGENGYLFIVADGMGGMAAGEVASRLAISTSVNLIQRSTKWGFKINQREAREMFERISQYIREIDQALTDESESNRRLLGMGTTLTAAYSMGVDLFVIHVGDSRVYLHRGGKLQQLTKDHTVAQAMADAGYIDPSEVRSHVRRNALTNFLGGQQGKVRADVRWLRLRDGDRLLLCTDGLTEMVDDDCITKTLDQHAASQDAARILLEQALDNGGKDNVTIVVARYTVPIQQDPGRPDSADRRHQSDTTTLSIRP
jgi:protein phosphatase